MCQSRRTRSLGARSCSRQAGGWGWAQGARDHRDTCVELSLGCHRFQRLLPETRAGSLGFRATWWHVPRRPSTDPSLKHFPDWFPKAVDEIKTHEAAETDLGGSIQRVNPNLQMQRCHAAKCSYQE